MKMLLRTTAVVILGIALLGTPAFAEAISASFDSASADAERDLRAALDELASLREGIAAEKVPLDRELRRLEAELTGVRAEYDEATRTLDTRNLDLGNFRKEIEAGNAEHAYLSNLLDEYARNFETRVHVAELQRLRETIDAARLAPEDPDADATDVYRAQAALVAASLDRVEGLLGGTRFEGQAVAPDGRVRDVRFALVGPVALYEDGTGAGLAEQRLNSYEPRLVPFDDPVAAAAVRSVVAIGSGAMPFDPTLGNALKVVATKETLREHVTAGGPVMVPILLLAAAALVTALVKSWQLARVPRPSQKRVAELLEAVRRRDVAKAIELARGIRGPTGEMLQAGVAHLREPRELVEEIMFERTLEAKLGLQRFLSFIALTAAAAPLLGLLGTVTGIMNTFKLITVFGTGDARTLSSGISEALITTEFGLIVAIPSLLLHAYLSRKVRRMLDGMEKTAVSFLNRLGASHMTLELAVAGSGEPERRRPAVRTELAEPLTVRRARTAEELGH